MEVDVYDPWADPAEVIHEYGIEIVNGETKGKLDQYSAIILAVATQGVQGLEDSKVWKEGCFWC